MNVRVLGKIYKLFGRRTSKKRSQHFRTCAVQLQCMLTYHACDQELDVQSKGCLGAMQVILIYGTVYLVFMFIYHGASTEWVYSVLDWDKPSSLALYVFLPLALFIAFVVWCAPSCHYTALLFLHADVRLKCRSHAICCSIVAQEPQHSMSAAGTAVV